ncbi:MAG: DUF4965 domain-containing protein, partial [Lachnospiraceae bacterium]|nr:DUF4965 domain-containing protein [Lachnospiraceae bacterium]
MIIKKASSIPIIVSDPYFSIWSDTDKLYEGDLVHWAKMRQKIRGYINVDGEIFCFMGNRQFHNVIEQKYVDVTATATEYFFENEKVTLKVRFTSPLIGDDLTLVSRPCTYVDFEVTKKKADVVKINMILGDELVSGERGQMIIGDSFVQSSKNGNPAFNYAYMGRAFQKPLGNSGDNISIDWGYAYVAATDMNVSLSFDQPDKQLMVDINMENTNESDIIIAYDDIISINYFGQWRKAYWTNIYGDILTAIGASFYDKADVIRRAKAVDEDIYNKAYNIGKEKYAFLCNMSYRHAFAAHKLITDDEGNVIFLSKENDSNGCIGTVDVSYPSVPLFLLYNTEYVKGMLRPVFKFAQMDVWDYDFAPHDVGRYPYAWGQVYGLNPKKWEKAFSGAHGAIFPNFYMYPQGSEIYDLRYQMPVEECGNMLILTSVVCKMDGSAEFAKPYLSLLDQWAKYLLEYGEDPGEQLCTDDFAGHLSHNVNLSAKAILGIEAYARLLEQSGDEIQAAYYHDKAVNMAKSWEERAKQDDHYALAFGSDNTWSLKYN